MKNLFIKKSRAQGILEVIIAIYITIIGILSIINLVLTNLQTERFNHNMLIATNLAKEGIEIVRSARDSNWIDDHPFYDGLTLIGGGERTFIITNWYVYEVDNNSYSVYNGYNVNYIGVSWDQCISESYSDINYGAAPCRLRLINPNANQNIKMYAHPYTYNDTSEENTNFYRIIYINDICYSNNDNFIPGQESIMNGSNTCSDAGNRKIGMQIISKVGWYERGAMKTTSIEESMYDWK